MIGGGFGGIAAALRLRALGYHVTLVERLPELGGRARVFRRGGFVFDAGPTVVTAPGLFEELFALFGESMADHVEMLPVEPWYRIRFDDGRHFDYGGTEAAMEAEVARIGGAGEVAGYRRLAAHGERLFAEGFERRGATPFTRAASMLRALPPLLALGAHRSLYARAAAHLRSEELRQVFSLQSLLVGGNPFTTTSVYGLIQHLERRWGIWFPRGGTGALVAALGGLLERTGVTVLTGATVGEIKVRDGRVAGVALEGGRRLPATTVVSNADPAALYARLLPGLPRRRRWTPRRLDGLRHSMGLFILYFGARRRWSEVAHHTILLGPRYRGLLDDVFRRGVLAQDPSLYLHRPTATDPSLAPPDQDGFYVLAPVPNLQTGASIDWDKEGPRLRELILDRLEATVLPGLRKSLVEAFHVDPRYFRDELLSEHGAGFSIEPRLTQSAWFRFHNASEEVDGLYLVGAGTHPGAGLPGVLSSAKVVEAILRQRVPA